MYDFMMAYSHFELSDYSQEELEQFGFACSSQLLSVISMIRFTNASSNNFKPFGFTKRELGLLSDLGSKMIRGVNLNGGYENYCELLHDFLSAVSDLETAQKDNSAKQDLKYGVAKLMRDRTTKRLNGSMVGYML